ncbi:MAG: glycine--tRNA ligase [Phycisphaerales bacterium]
MSTTETPNAADNTTKSMDEIMSLCKRRGFVYQASEIYGGINGFWDYGPLGAILKKNLRDAWWNDVVMLGASGAEGPNGKPVTIVPVDTCIIQNPKVWEASGHVGGFNDPMVDCRETKSRYRADHVMVLYPSGEASGRGYAYIESDDESRDRALKNLGKYVKRDLADGETESVMLTSISADQRAEVVGPDTKEPGTLTEPRAFNLMFPTVIGATGDIVDDKAYLRPETAQGIFINFKNVVDTMRVRVPFGIGQTGKAFRNEVTPRNFTFRSREFEQMEVEFFCHEEDAKAWYAFWRDSRFAWWQSIGLAGDNLQLREHEADELAHYAKTGAGTSDIEYRFPFTAPGFGELEGVAHRSDYDLQAHQTHSKNKMEYFDTERGEIGKNGAPKGEKYVPHCIEPSAGLDRGVLALLCEAYTPDPDRASGVYMRFHPRMAPIKAAVFPLVNKDGMPEIAEKLHAELAKKYASRGMVAYDAKQSIGKRYARMDEAGCPYCFTIDSDTLADNTVTVRHRDSQDQERIALDKVVDFLGEKLGL